MSDRRPSAYEEACQDRNMVRIDSTTVIRPFHPPVTGVEQEFHVYCSEHPEFGFCGVEGDARYAAMIHGNVWHK